MNKWIFLLSQKTRIWDKELSQVLEGFEEQKSRRVRMEVTQLLFRTKLAWAPEKWLEDMPGIQRTSGPPTANVPVNQQMLWLWERLAFLDLKSLCPKNERDTRCYLTVFLPKIYEHTMNDHFSSQNTVLPFQLPRYSPLSLTWATQKHTFNRELINEYKKAAQCSCAQNQLALFNSMSKKTESCTVFH